MIKFLKDIKNIDYSIVKVRNLGFKFSFVLCLLFTYILFLYTLNPISHIAFDIGYLGVKASLMFFTSFFVGAISANMFKNKLI